TRTQRFNSDDVISMDTHPPVANEYGSNAEIIPQGQGSQKYQFESVTSVWRAGKKERAADQSAALFQLTEQGLRIQA
ncbi:MAG: hypothetical protein WAV66_06435, partial [Anaerolineae bacterium]